MFSKFQAIFLTFFFIAASYNLFAGSDKTVVDSSFIVDEKRISHLVAELIEIRFNNDSVKTLNDRINKDFEAVLQKEGSFDYPFDSIFPVGKVVSDDGLVRIFTWYMVRADGSHAHSGFLQYYNKSEKKVLLYPLIDKSDEIEDVENKTLSNEEWFGATYYQIVDSKSVFGPLYVLLGWDGNTIYSHKKILESLVFTEGGRPKFGKPVFVSGRIKAKRIIFEYSRMASMMLEYNKDLNMIVMDHLSPSKPMYQGNPQFYGPDLSYDAFKPEGDYWVYYPAIDYKPVEKKKWLKRRSK